MGLFQVLNEMRWVKHYIIGPDYLVYIPDIIANVIIEEVLSVSTTYLGAEPPGLHVTQLKLK